MEIINNRKFHESENIFGDRRRSVYEEVEYVGTPAELAELVKTEPYVYVRFYKDLKQNAQLVEQLNKLNLLPERMDWESEESYFDGFNLIVFNHGEVGGFSTKDFEEISPVFTFKI